MASRTIFGVVILSYCFLLVLIIKLHLCATSPIVVRRPARPVLLFCVSVKYYVHCQLYAVQSSFVSARVLYVCIPLSLLLTQECEAGEPTVSTE